jgi:hypothetical protein
MAGRLSLHAWIFIGGFFPGYEGKENAPNPCRTERSLGVGDPAEVCGRKNRCAALPAGLLHIMETESGSMKGMGAV